jgi:YidC/Oxa1 family membrane protein insertase
MDRQLFVTLALCMGIMMVWQKYFMPAPQQPVQQTQVTQTANTQRETAPPAQTMSPQSKGAKAELKKASPDITVKAPQSVSFNTSNGTAQLDNGNFFIRNWTLKNYRVSLNHDASAVDMSALGKDIPGQVEIAFDDQALAYLNNVRGDLSANNVWTYEDSNVKMTKKFISSPTLPFADIEIETQFKNTIPKYAFISARASTGGTDNADGTDQYVLYWTNDSIERLSLKDASQIKEIKTPVKYIGVTSHYFTFAMVSPDDQPSPIGLIQPLHRTADGGPTRISLVYPIDMKGNTARFAVRAYYGPKDLTILRQVHPKLDHIVDFGWFTFIAYPILRTLKWFNSFVHNYGISIILLTLLLKILTYPLQYKSMKSMKDVAKVQPLMAKLKEKYKDDTAAYNREVMTLMRTHNYNPLMGCLPMLIQIPIFIALFQVLRSSIELYQAPFALWIHDLSAKDPYYITPAILTATMFFQQKLTPSTAGMDPAQAKMMKFMPVVFGAMMINLASGLTLYMLISTVTGIIQQVILNKKLGITNAPAIASFS